MQSQRLQLSSDIITVLGYNRSGDGKHWYTYILVAL